MIVGRGLVATAFRPYEAALEDTVVFASGVSDSRETRDEAFAREEGLLRDSIATGRRLFYFGSCSVLDPEMAGTAYVRHKLRMEELVRTAQSFTIFRLPQVVGRSDNPVLLTNFLHSRIASDTPFEVWTRARRNLIDVDHVAAIAMAMAPDADCMTENVACPFSVSVSEIVAAFEKVLGRTARFSTVDAGGAYAIEAAWAARCAAGLGIAFDDRYIETVIGKYYGR
ncbi:MAG: NAD-dependent epimerase/dehydratase family protein [Phreatobacter sp.]|uniref:NAD-dependent epimerase/dehydratase family protein n=1 Tax=Phreatobacter sp. TaxID=1966341 RepID=UPI0040365234